MRLDGMSYNQYPAGERPIFSQRGVSFPQRDSVRPDTDQPGKREGQVGPEDARNQEAALSRSILKQQQNDKLESERRSLFEHDPTDEEDKGMLEKLSETIREINGDFEAKHISLRFRLHQDSERWMVQIFDILEDEVIREIPPERVLDLSARIQGMVGAMIDSHR